MWLKDQIEKYIPYNEQEEKDKEIMLASFETFDDVLTRKNKIAHFTASNWVVNRERTKVLMAYHNIYHSWAWTGGHADGDDNLFHVALKELQEETGLIKVKDLKKDIFGLEVLTVDGHVKNGIYIPSHLHLDCCFLLEADEEEQTRIKPDENKQIQWIKVEDVVKVTTEPKMVPIYQKLIDKMKNI